MVREMNAGLTMPQRIASILSLLVFAACLVIGGIEADNTFATTVYRALVAMAGTFIVGLLLGFVAQKMLEENLMFERKKLENKPTETDSSDR
jgi:hypothetical protein